jgi:ABC-2 type transport system permease protein
MRKSWLVFVNSLQRMRALALISLLVGALLSVLFMTFANLMPTFASPPKLGYTDYDNSAVSADFKRYATERLGMELVEGDADFLASELVDKRLSALVEIPQGFGAAVLAGSDGAIQTTFMDDYANRAFIQSYLEGYTASLALLAGAAQGDEARFEQMLAGTHEQSVAVLATPLEEDQAQRMQDWSIFIVVLGFFLMISSMIAIGMANIVYDDRQNGTWQRVRASNVNTVSYVLGVCSAGFVAALAMAAVFFGFLALIGKGAALPLGGAFLLSLLYGLFVVGFALVVGLLAKSRMAVFWLVVVVATVACLMGGAYFPVDFAPPFMQQLAHLMPPFWYIDALNKMWEGDASGWPVSALILGLFSLLCFLIAGIRFASRGSTMS